ncbi:MAG: FxsA family protein [Nitrospinaceae bacterium]
MSLAVVLSFGLGTAVELYLLNWISGYISIVNTINLVMLTFLVGVVVGRSWGKEYFEKMQWHLKSRTLPPNDVLNGSVLTVASMLLITPGLVTDMIGLLILIPITRGIFKELALHLVKKRISRGELYFFFKN